MEKYCTTDEAIKINNFNPDNFSEDKKLTSSELVSLFENIREKYFTKSEKGLIRLAGHNIQFDISFLQVLFSSVGKSFSDLFLHRYLDTFSILQYLIHCNIIPPNINNSDKAFVYFNVKINDRHTGMGDAEGEANLYEKMLKLL